MRDDDLIERYLKQLDVELRLPPRARRRILAEARDHLRELADGAGAESDAASQARAIDAFGSPAIVARRFGYELAVGATRRRRAASMFLLALVLWDLCTSSFLHVAPGWVNDGPGSASLWILGQVGLVAGPVSLARARIARRVDDTDTIRLRYIVRGLIVLSSCTVLTVAIAAAGVASATTTHSPRHDSWVLLAALTLGCAAVTAISASATWRAKLDDPQLATSAPALITVEAALVLAGYATLGRYLGLRPTRTSTTL